MNLAELLPITFDSNKLKEEWEELYFKIDSGLWDWRVYPDIEYFTPYIKSLLISIVEQIGVTPKNYLIQISNNVNQEAKNYLSLVHKDDDRKSCITIPLIYNIMETIMFYNENPKVNWMLYRKTGKIWPDKPCQVTTYSQYHPTLVNVSNLHNVRVLDNQSHRVLLQLSFDETFNDIISKNPDIWKVI
jgi:hypothetical protein